MRPCNKRSVFHKLISNIISHADARAVCDKNNTGSENVDFQHQTTILNPTIKTLYQLIGAQFRGAAFGNYRAQAKLFFYKSSFKYPPIEIRFHINGSYAL